MKKLLQWVIKALTAFDWPLLALVILMAVIGMTIMRSAVEGLDWRFADQLRNFFIAFGLMWLVAMVPPPVLKRFAVPRSEEHTSELQSLMRLSYAVFCLNKKTTN